MSIKSRRIIRDCRLKAKTNRTIYLAPTGFLLIYDKRLTLPRPRLRQAGDCHRKSPVKSRPCPSYRGIQVSREIISLKPDQASLRAQRSNLQTTCCHQGDCFAAANAFDVLTGWASLAMTRLSKCHRVSLSTPFTMGSFGPRVRDIWNHYVAIITKKSNMS